MFKFKPKSEKIYKFVYEPDGSIYSKPRKTMLLTACDPVEAVKMFNKMTNHILYNIVEFTEVTCKTEDKE